MCRTPVVWALLCNQVHQLATRISKERLDSSCPVLHVKGEGRSKQETWDACKMIIAPFSAAKQDEMRGGAFRLRCAACIDAHSATDLMHEVRRRKDDKQTRGSATTPAYMHVCAYMHTYVHIVHQPDA